MAQNVYQDLNEKYPKGVQFNDKGYPDFSSHQVKEVSLANMKGTFEGGDFVLADHLAGIDKSYREENQLTWHHEHDTKIMRLVPKDLHSYVTHVGGRYVLTKLGLLRKSEHKVNQIRNTSPSSASLEMIAELENFYKIELPEDYKKFLLDYNGGVVVTLVPIIGRNIDSNTIEFESALGILYGLNRSIFNGQIDELLTNLNLLYASQEDVTAGKLLPIGEAGGTAQLCISVTKDNTFGKIYVWDTELAGNVEIDMNSEHVYIVANNFLSLINELEILNA